MPSWIVFVSSPKVLVLDYPTIGFYDGAPHALIAKTKSNQSQGPEAT